MNRITLADGRWLELRTMWVDDELFLDELGHAGDELESTEDNTGEKAQRYFALLRSVKARIDDATLEASWEGGAGQMTTGDLLGLIGRWRTETENTALPPG